MTDRPVLFANVLCAGFLLIPACSSDNTATAPDVSGAGGAMGTGGASTSQESGTRLDGSMGIDASTEDDASGGAGGATESDASSAEAGVVVLLDGSNSDGNTSDSGAVRLPTGNAPFDYQIGGGYPPPSGVQIVSRDRNDMPAPGLYNICYVNGFQAQPDEATWWQTTHPDLLLRDAGGAVVIDTD